MKLVKKTAFFSLLASLLLTYGFSAVFTINLCLTEAPLYRDGKYRFNGTYVTFDSCESEVDSGLFSAVSDPKRGNDFCDSDYFNADTRFYLFHNVIEKILDISFKRDGKSGPFYTKYEDGQDMYECWKDSNNVQLGISCGPSETCYTITADVRIDCDDN